MNEQEKEIYTKRLANLVNSYYFLVEASDMLLREAEKHLDTVGEGLKHEVKHRHSLLMQEARKMKNINDAFFNDYAEAFGGKLGVKYDELRNTASFYARLALLIGDRCCDSDNWQKEQHITEFIENMPGYNLVSSETYSNLTIR